MAFGEQSCFLPRPYAGWLESALVLVVDITEQLNAENTMLHAFENVQNVCYMSRSLYSR